VEFRGNTPGQIFDVTEEVFAAAGYKVSRISPLRLLCEKPGSTMSNLAYGEWLPEKPLYIRVKLTLIQENDAVYRLRALAYNVTDRGGMMEEEKLIHMGKGRYKKMLDEVATKLKAPGK